MPKHTLSVLVENKPGVLTRIAALFSRRGFNIDSLAVGPTEHSDVSRMTVVVDVDEAPLEQVTKQLNKLVEVLKVVELDQAASVQRQILLIKVRSDAAARSHIIETVDLFRGKIIDVGPDTLTIEVTCKLLRESGLDPDALRGMVTSPGGTTIHGLLALEKGGFGASVAEAVFAATRRSQELGG